MRLLSIICLSFLLVFSHSVKADEGMWLPMFIKRLNFEDMQKKGLQLTAEEIYSVNQSSLKDAIVSLGGFCTGEMISSQGLMLTNHHCGYDAIQQFSTVENDYLGNGFWAKTKSDEIPVPELTATFLVRMEDVTKEILGAVTEDMSAEQKEEAIAQVKKDLIGSATDGTHYSAYIKDFFYGNEYYLFVNETFTDVRLVGAPQESIGKYGGDTDNWMWPRHTGDFCLFRVYSGKDGKPADHSEYNVPFEPRHHLPVSIAGVEEGDFSMIMGYPGSTDRYLSSYGVKQAIEKHGPTVVEIRDQKLKTMKSFMDKDKAVRIQYASKYAQVANYWKYYIGQTEQLQSNGVIAKKQALENEFRTWVKETPERQVKYGNALKDIENYYKVSDDYEVGDVYVLEAGLTGPDVFLFSFRSKQLLDAYTQVTQQFEAQIEKTEDPATKTAIADQLKQTQVAILDQLEESKDEHYKNYYSKLDEKLVEELTTIYSNKVTKGQQPEYFNTLVKGNSAKFAKKLFRKSVFAKKRKTDRLIKKLRKGKDLSKKLEKDLAVIASSQLAAGYFGSKERYGNALTKLEEGNRLFLEGVRLMEPSKSFYPNANSTQRLTYGQVLKYDLSDKVKKTLRSQDGVGSHFTTIDGLIEKEDASNPEFRIPSKLKELYKKKDYGPYADKKDGNLHVCFLSNNDITGGNSGSPVINGKGELIGTAFDGNWEAMSGDISFENKVQRTISVDIRYTLWIIDKVSGAKHLIDEMTVVD